MFQRWVLVANAIITAISGLGFLFAADAVLGLYGGMSMEPATDHLFGGALIGLALINFLARDVQARDATRAILTGNLIYNVVTLYVFITGAAVLNSIAVWLGVAVAVAFTAAFGYLTFKAFSRQS